MSAEVRSAKKELRRRTREILGGLSAAQRAGGSEQACTRVAGQPAWRSAASILFYAPAPEELDIWPLLVAALEEGRTVALPRFDPPTGGYLACQVRRWREEVVPGKYGLREPAPDCPVLPLNQLDFVLVPGVAFDLRGFRLGRGKGYYDRLLAEVRGIACGVAFDEQIVDRVPMEPHDLHLNCILTPTRWVERPPARAVLE